MCRVSTRGVVSNFFSVGSPGFGGGEAFFNVCTTTKTNRIQCLAESSRISIKAIQSVVPVLHYFHVWFLSPKTQVQEYNMEIFQNAQFFSVAYAHDPMSRPVSFSVRSCAALPRHVPEGKLVSSIHTSAASSTDGFSQCSALQASCVIHRPRVFSCLANCIASALIERSRSGAHSDVQNHRNCTRT